MDPTSWIKPLARDSRPEKEFSIDLIAVVLTGEIGK